jgi:hypothetical protein
MQHQQNQGNPIRLPAIDRVIDNISRSDSSSAYSPMRSGLNKKMDEMEINENGLFQPFGSKIIPQDLEDSLIVSEYSPSIQNILMQNGFQKKPDEEGSD